MLRRSLLLVLLLLPVLAYATTDTYTTAGNFTWTCPTGVTSVQVEVWGGGGVAGNGDNSTLGGGGGGGGGYSRLNAYMVTPGNNYTVHVAAGGTGTNSYFNTTGTVLANSGSNGTTGGAGGAGGGSVTAIGDVKFAGGAGAANQTYQGGGGGSSAGPAAAGVTATTTAGATAPSGGGSGGAGDAAASGAVAGASPGGGGGGGYYVGVGAAGAPGKVVLTYTVQGTGATARQFLECFP